MAVKIRLARTGAKNAPMYRIVAIDSRRQRDGKALEILGSYNPGTGRLVQFHEDRLNAWVQEGAVVSDAVKRLQRVYRKHAAQPAPVSVEAVAVEASPEVA